MTTGDLQSLTKRLITGVRYAIGWMNDWKYANREVPTDASDGYNGQFSVVRELRLRREADGRCALVSTPVPALAAAATAERTLPDVTVEDAVVLDVDARAYELELDLTWDAATNVGLSVGRSEDGARHTNIGVTDGRVYVDRGPSDLEGFSFGEVRQAEAPIDPAARAVHLRVLVDTQSVEVFVDDGYTVLSQQVHLLPGDTGASLYADGGPLHVTGVTLREH